MSELGKAKRFLHVWAGKFPVLFEGVRFSGKFIGCLSIAYEVPAALEDHPAYSVIIALCSRV